MIDRWGERLPTLGELGLTVETGRQVAHRHPETLRHDGRDGAVPYIDRPHVRPNALTWPRGQVNFKNYYDPGNDPNPVTPMSQGWYVAVNRFAPNEDNPRIRACVISPHVIDSDFIGSNQTNIIRRDLTAIPATENNEREHLADARGRGTRNGMDQSSLDQETAEALAAWINTAVANQMMALRLGSTQVNAVDLERLPIPTTRQLEDLRRRTAAGHHEATEARPGYSSRWSTSSRWPHEPSKQCVGSAAD